MTWLTDRGILDNEASENYLQAFKRNIIEYEKVPPKIHQRNMEEKAISMFKGHFQAITVGINSTFPMHVWDCLLPQAERTLSMMLPTNICQQYQHMHTWISNMILTKCLQHPWGVQSCYNKPYIQKLWGTDAMEDFYMETSWEHYRCYKMWSKKHLVYAFLTWFFIYILQCQQSAKWMP